MKKNKFFLSILLIILLSVGCNNVSTNLSTSSNIDSSEMIDYDKEDIDINYLKENNCVFFEDLVFAKDKKNHIFKIQDNKIVDHITYPLVDFNPDNYNKVIGKDIIEAVKIIGCPTFIGLEKELSLDYSDYDGYLRRLFIDKQEEKYIIKDVKPFSKFGNLNVFYDRERISKTSLEQAKKLKVGMCIDEVVRIVGKLSDNRSSTLPTQSIILENGKKLILYIDKGQTKDCEHMKHDSEMFDSYFYYYLYRYKIEGEETKNYISDKVEPFKSNDNLFMDESKITIDYLKSQHCFFFENMVFASDKKNHVFFIEDNKIKGHKIYDKIAYPKDAYHLFKSVEGMNFIDTFNIIGIPTHFRDGSGLTLQYSLPYEIMYRITLKKVNNVYKIESLIDNYSKLSYHNYGTNQKTNISMNDFSLITKDMCIDEVMEIIGRPETSSLIDRKGYLKFTYTSIDNKNLEVIFKLDYIVKECEHAIKHNEYHYDEEGLNIFSPNIYYFYVDAIDIMS